MMNINCTSTNGLQRKIMINVKLIGFSTSTHYSAVYASSTCNRPQIIYNVIINRSFCIYYVILSKRARNIFNWPI